MCPEGWSAEEGMYVEGIVLGPGVAVCSANAGGETARGVMACSVASRLEGGVEAGRLHPAITRKRLNVNKSLSLFVIQFDRFKIKLLAR